MRRDGAEARMKADEGAAANRDARRSAGHHVMVAGTVIALVVANGAHDGQLVGNRTEALQVLREVDAGYPGLDRIERATVITRPDPGKLTAWLDEYSLGELWEKNVIGGRPA